MDMDTEVHNFWSHVSSLLSGDLNQAWLARETGINPMTLSGWKNKGRIPPADRAMKIAQALGVSVEYLISGTYSDEDYDEKEVEYKRYGSKQVMHGQHNDDSILYVPKLQQRVSAGYGTEIIEEFTPEERVPILKRLISSYDADKLHCVEVAGDSMTGISLNDGDIAIFCQDCIRGDGIYVISVDGEALVKRLEFDRIQKKVKIYSENPRYPDPNIISADSDIISIEGKVVAWIHQHPY